MARLVGVDLPRDKRTEIALTYIFGVGRTRARETLAATGVDPNKRVRDLTDEELRELDRIAPVGASKGERYPEAGMRKLNL